MNASRILGSGLAAGLILLGSMATCHAQAVVSMGTSPVPTQMGQPTMGNYGYNPTPSPRIPLQVAPSYPQTYSQVSYATPAAACQPRAAHHSHHHKSHGSTQWAAARPQGPRFVQAGLVRRLPLVGRGFRAR